jgi:heterodisulfide reductase subunit A-like polyferredoxin
MADLGVANVIARSAFVNQVDEEACIACGACEESCPFGALSVVVAVGAAVVDKVRCVGCGVCALACPQGALSLVRRPEQEVLATPVTEEDWMARRAADRGIELDAVL